MKTAHIASWIAAGLVTLSFGCAVEEGRNRTGPPNGGGDETPRDVPQGSSGVQLKPTDVLQRCDSSQRGRAVLRRLTRGELQATVEDVFPEIRSEWRGVRLSQDPASALGFGNDSATLLVGAQTASEILKTAEDVADLVTADSRLSTVLPCAGDANEACAGEFVDQYGMRLFRRPLSEGERGEYLGLFNSVSSQSNFKTGIKWTLVALLQSPHAIYRSELGTPGDGGRELSGYELATQLAYAFGGSTPDRQLLELAEQGALSEPSVRVEQARRLLRSPRGQEVVRNFFRSWLNYRSIIYAQRDQVPDFATEIAPELVQETERFIDQVVFQDGGDLRELLMAPYTVLNAKLAQYYGFGNVSGDWAQVDRPWGAGIFAQGSVLVSTAHENMTSPTLRGLLVFNRLLCNDPIRPPALVPPLEETAGSAKTTREMYEIAHLSGGGACANCHEMFDPPGFTFEHFDETGRYREQDNGYPIDESGNIPLRSGDIVELSGFDDLIQQIEEVPQLSDCISGLMTAYMLSGGGGQTCLAEEQRTALAQGDIGIEEFFIQMATVPHFTSRH